MPERLTDAALEGLERAAGGCAPARRVVEMRIEDVLGLLAEVRAGRARQAALRAPDFDAWVEKASERDTLARELAQALEGACAEIGRHYEMGPYESPWLKLRARARAAGLLGKEGG